MLPVVWVVSGEHWPRACLRAELIERGYDAVGFETISDAQRALGTPGARRPAVTIVDLSGQAGDDAQLAAFARQAGRIIGVAGAVEARSDDVRKLPWNVLLVRPVTLGAVADAVEPLLSRAAT